MQRGICAYRKSGKRLRLQPESALQAIVPQAERKAAGWAQAPAPGLSRLPDQGQPNHSAPCHDASAQHQRALPRAQCRPLRFDHISVRLPVTTRCASRRGKNFALKRIHLPAMWVSAYNSKETDGSEMLISSVDCA
jgi:hypothetical protein